MQPARTRTDQRLVGAPLDNGHVDPRQRQLRGQRQPGRAASDDHHGVVRTLCCQRRPPFDEFSLRPCILRHDPALAASPRVRYRLEVRESSRLRAELNRCVGDGRTGAGDAEVAARTAALTQPASGSGTLPRWGRLGSGLAPLALERQPPRVGRDQLVNGVGPPRARLVHLRRWRVGEQVFGTLP